VSTSVSLNGTIKALDTVAGTSALIKNVNQTSAAGTTFSEASGFIAHSGGTAVPLPVANIDFLYVKNLDVAATILVTWTPNGGSTLNPITLEPGGFIMFSEGATGAGITALTLTSSASQSLVEFVLGGGSIGGF
jgi:hypothetical protein